jgi:hypothetical protein
VDPKERVSKTINGSYRIIKTHKQMAEQKLKKMPLKGQLKHQFV